MKARVIAWVLVFGALFGAYKGWTSWKNPWGGGAGVPLLTSPVLSNLPATAPGCGEKCLD